jgi:hypothetical protein
MRENRQLTEFLSRKKIDKSTGDWIMRFAWSRTIQLLFTAAFGIIIIVSYDWEFNETRNALIELTDAVEQRQAIAQEKLAKAAAAPTTAAPTAPVAGNAATALLANAPPAPPPLTAAPAAKNPDVGYATVIKPSTAPVVLTAPVNVQAAAAISATEGEQESDNLQLPTEEGDKDLAPLSEPVNPGIATNTAEATPSTLDQVYNPEREQGIKGDDQSSMDDIKKRYEDILVIYMFLKHCGRIESTDYNIITSALAQEMASVNAPGRLQFDIVNSAKGSYQEIYSQSPCDGNGIGKLIRQYHQYIDVLQQNFPPQ